MTIFNFTKNLKIIMLITELGYGGAESTFLRLAKFLSDYAVVTIVVINLKYRSKDYYDKKIDTNLPIIILDNGSKYHSNLIKKFLKWVLMIYKFKKIKAENDIVISFLSGSNLLNIISGYNQKSIISERGSKIYNISLTKFKKILWIKILDKFIYFYSSAIVPASIDYESEVKSVSFSFLNKKIKAIEGAIDIKEISLGLNISCDEDIVNFCLLPTIIISGRIDKGKGIDLLIPVLLKIKKNISYKYKILIIGDGSYMDELILKFLYEGFTITKSGDKNADIYFTGFRDKPYRHYKLGTVFVFTSLHEGLPNSLIEAVASGIPILAADCPWGVRSILDSENMSDKISLRNYPIKMKNGVLMPQLGNKISNDIWYTTLTKYIINWETYTKHVNKIENISNFDINFTGFKWLELINGIHNKNINIQ